MQVHSSKQCGQQRVQVDSGYRERERDDYIGQMESGRETE